MKDFGTWLSDLTEELQEKDEPKLEDLRAIADELQANLEGTGALFSAYPEPCSICGSSEEVCECEEEEGCDAEDGSILASYFRWFGEVEPLWNGGSGRITSPAKEMTATEVAKRWEDVRFPLPTFSLTQPVGIPERELIEGGFDYLRYRISDVVYRFKSYDLTPETFRVSPRLYMAIRCVAPLGEYDAGRNELASIAGVKVVVDNELREESPFVCLTGFMEGRQK